MRILHLSAGGAALLLALGLLVAPRDLRAQETHAAHRAHGASPAPADSAVRLLRGLGSHHRRITTRSAQAQRFFDQGLALAYAFNHGEALRSFREAARL